MTLTVTIADNADGQRLLDGVCNATNYDPASGITKGQWVKDKLVDHIRITAKRGEIRATSLSISNAIEAIVIT